MRTKYQCVLIALLVMLAALFIGNQLNAQTQPKSQVKKQVKTSKSEGTSDSVVVVVKTLTHDGTIISENTDSLIHALCPSISEYGEKKMHIIQIKNGDTVINRCFEEPMDLEWVKQLQSNTLFHSFPGTMNADSFKFWISEFDSILDPQNNLSFDFEWTGDLEGLDTLMEKHIEYQLMGNSLDSMIFLSIDGDKIRFEKGGEMVFLDKKEDIDEVESNIQVTRDDKGRKVIVLETRIVLDELSEQEKQELNSNGITTSKQEPEFDYIRFYPNPVDKLITVEFKLSKRMDCEVRIVNMLGQKIYEEKLKDFSGDYKSSIDLKKNGTGTYVLQILQGKKSISRKIIVK